MRHLRAQMVGVDASSVNVFWVRLVGGGCYADVGAQTAEELATKLVNRDFDLIEGADDATVHDEAGGSSGGDH